MKHTTDNFTKRMFFRLFIPSLASSFGLALADMADAVVVGQRMGATGLAAISISLPLYMVLNVFMHGLGIGGSVRYSQLLGEGKATDAVNCFNRVMHAGLIVSVLIAALVNLFPNTFLQLLGTSTADGGLYEASKSYVCIIALGAPLFFLNYMLNYFLRNDDNQRLASIGFLLGNIIDILFNLIFVLWLDMETTGAALATLIGLAVSIVCYLPGMISKNHILKPKFIKPNLREVLSCFRTGFATSSQYIFQMLFLLICNNVLIRISGQNGLAVFDMVQNASYLILYLYEGAAKAIQPLVSTYHGEKNRTAARHTLKLGLGWGLAAGGVATVLIWLFPSFICGVFGLNGEALTRLGTLALRIFGVSGAFAGISILLETYYQSVNQERCAFTITLMRGCIVLLPFTVLFSFLSIEWFWWLYPVNEILSLVLFFILRHAAHWDAASFDTARVFSLTIRGQNDDILKLNNGIEAFCKRWNATPRQQYFVTMAAEEVCVAIINNAFNRIKNGYIQVTLVALKDGNFELHIRDNAEIFNPFSLQTGMVGNENDFDIDAVGMMVIKKQAKDFFYRQYQGFNSLVVRI